MTDVYAITDVNSGAAVRPLKVLASQGDVKVGLVTVDIGPYASGGNVVNLASKLGLTKILAAFPTLAICGDDIGVVDGPSVYGCKYDITNDKLLAFCVSTTANSGEPTSGADLTGYDVTLLVFGM